MLEICAKAIASRLGYEWDTLYARKSEWTADRGSRHDINVPFKPEFTEAARAVIETLMEPTKSMLFFGMDAMARDDLEPTEDEFRAGFTAALRAATGDQFGALSQPNEEGEGK